MIMKIMRIIGDSDSWWLLCHYGIRSFYWITNVRLNFHNPAKPHCKQNLSTLLTPLSSIPSHSDITGICHSFSSTRSRIYHTKPITIDSRVWLAWHKVKLEMEPDPTQTCQMGKKGDRLCAPKFNLLFYIRRIKERLCKPNPVDSIDFLFIHIEHRSFHMFFMLFHPLGGMFSVRKRRRLEHETN